MVVRSPFSTRTMISYGIIAFAADTKRWFVVRRKHSAEFMMILRGSYRPAHLFHLLTGVTREEITLLEKYIHGEKTYKEIFSLVFPAQSNVDYGQLRFNESLTLIKTILNGVRETASPLEWVWPKGRPQSGEDSFTCALREFDEEAGVDLSSATYVSPRPLTETLCTTMGRVFESRCWLYVLPYEIEPKPLEEDNIEISDRRWFTEEELQVVLSTGKYRVLTEAKNYIA